MIENLYLEDFKRNSNYLYSYPFPTGAGKSYSLFNSIKKYIENSNNNIFIYIVPFKNLFKQDYDIYQNKNIKIIRLYSTEDIFKNIINENNKLLKNFINEIKNINNLKNIAFNLNNELNYLLKLDYKIEKDKINKIINLIKYELKNIFNENNNIYNKYKNLYNLFFPLLQIKKNGNYLIESTYDKIYFHQYYLKDNKITILPSFITNFYLLGNFKYKLFLDESKIGYEKLLNRSIENFGSKNIEIVYIITQIYKFYNDIKNYSKNEELEEFIKTSKELLNKKKKFFEFNKNKNYIKINNNEINELFEKKYLFYIENKDNFSSNIKNLLKNYYIIKTNKDYLLLTKNKNEKTRYITLYEYLLDFKDIISHFFNKTNENNEYIKYFILNNSRTSFYNDIYNLYTLINKNNVYIEDKLLEYQEDKKELNNILNINNFINNSIYHFNFSILNNSLINSLILEINNINNFPENFIIKNILNEKYDIKIWLLSASLEIKSNLKDFSKTLLKQFLKDKFITINDNNTIKSIIKNINQKRNKELIIKNIETQDLSYINNNIFNEINLKKFLIINIKEKYKFKYKYQEILNVLKSISYIINKNINSGLIFMQTTEYLNKFLNEQFNANNNNIYNLNNYKIIIYKKNINLEEIIKKYEKKYKIIIISDYINLGQGVNIEINNKDIECISFSSIKYYYLNFLNNNILINQDNYNEDLNKQNFIAKLNIFKSSIFLTENFNLQNFENYEKIYKNYENEYKNNELGLFLLNEKYKEILNNLLQVFGRCERKHTPNFLHILYSNDIKKEILNIKKFILNKELEKILSKNFINFINYFDKNNEENKYYGIENFYKYFQQRIYDINKKNLLINIGNSLRSINIINNPTKYYKDIINLINQIKPEYLKTQIEQDLNLNNIFNINNNKFEIHIAENLKILENKKLIKFNNYIIKNEIIINNNKLYINELFFKTMTYGNIGEEIFKNYINKNNNIKNITEQIFQKSEFQELYELVDFYIIYNNTLYLIDIKFWNKPQLKEKNKEKILTNKKLNKIIYKEKLNKNFKLVYINIFKNNNMNFHKNKKFYETYLIDENSNLQRIENILK